MAKSKSSAKKSKPSKSSTRNFSQSAFSGFQKSPGSATGGMKPKIVQRANRGR